jgi:hypothetical protein
MTLLGPTAVGELVIGQSICGLTASAAGGGGSAAGGGGSAASGGGTVASTGVEVARLIAFALLLLAIGGNVRYWAPAPVAVVRGRVMPWTRRQWHGVAGRRRRRSRFH